MYSSPKHSVCHSYEREKGIQQTPKIWKRQFLPIFGDKLHFSIFFGCYKEGEREIYIYINLYACIYIYINQPEQTHNGSRAWRTQRGVAVCPGSV
jgi:hypothetical protein